MYNKDMYMFNASFHKCSTQQDISGDFKGKKNTFKHSLHRHYTTFTTDLGQPPNPQENKIHRHLQNITFFVLRL